MKSLPRVIGTVGGGRGKNQTNQARELCRCLGFGSRHHGGTQHPRKALTRAPKFVCLHGKRGCPNSAVQPGTGSNCLALPAQKAPFAVRPKTHHGRAATSLSRGAALKVRCLSTDRQHRKPVCHRPRLLNRAKSFQEGWRTRSRLQLL